MAQLIRKTSFVLAFLVFMATLSFPGFRKVEAATCSTTAECNSILNNLKKQASDNQAKLNSSQKTADSLEAAIDNLDVNIGYTTAKITNTQAQIDATNRVITSLAGDIAIKQAEYDELMSRLRSAYVSLYELSQESTLEVILSSETLSDAVTKSQLVQELQSDLKSKADSVMALKTDLEQKKSESEAAKADLEALKNELVSTNASLGSQKTQKSYLLSATEDQIDQYLANASDIQKRIREVQRQLDILISRNSWGSDIISSNESSWYYSQLSYPNTRLGNSPYTVAQYGCLITSYAMVSRYYGNNVTPATIAGDTSNFNYGGYLLYHPPHSSGLSSGSKSAVNWGTVDSELASGRPVIVSIYLSSVGAINSDGSSHFIVIKGKASGKYLMHDPLGAGRSYAASSVRSMIIVR